MGPVVVVLLAAVLVGGLRGGRVSRLGELRLCRLPLVGAALLLQLAGGLLGGPAYGLGLAASALLVLVFLALNRTLPGGPLLALGLLSNALVVGLNGAMPVSLGVALRAGVDPLVAVADRRHEPLLPGTRLRLLADVVPVPLPLVPSVVSPGDVLVAAGLAQLVVLGMVGPPVVRSPRPHLPPLR